MTIVNGDPEYCSCHSCSEFEGDCDYHNQCQEGLYCRLNNCPASLGFESLVDCCQQIGNEHYCTAQEPCGVDQGDCDTDNECQGNLICGSNNCPNSFGFENETDCCNYGCKYHQIHMRHCCNIKVHLAPLQINK